MIHKGKSGQINISYATGDVSGCQKAYIPVVRHIVDPAGGTAGGMGPTFLVYDPKTITLKPVLHLAVVKESKGYSLE